MLITLPPTCNKDKTKVKSGEEKKKLEKNKSRNAYQLITI